MEGSSEATPLPALKVAGKKREQLRAPVPTSDIPNDQRQVSGYLGLGSGSTGFWREIQPRERLWWARTVPSP